MIFFPFASRSTTRRLHQTVQRNIFRQHQARRESTKNQNPHSEAAQQAPSARPIKEPAWVWKELFATPFRAYSAMQRRRPLLVQLESAMVVYYLGDLSAQAVQTSAFSDASYEPVHGLRALLIGGLISIPSYKWMLFLGNHFNYKSYAFSILVKIMVNQTFLPPVLNTYFFGMQSLLSGSTFAEAKRRVIDTVPVSWINSWKFWPVVMAFNFRFIQPQNRSVFAGLIAVFWQTYLSWLNRKAEIEEANEDIAHNSILTDDVLAKWEGVLDTAKA